MAYYLKYRPQTISDLDNENVREILLSVLSQEDVPHAYLFTGPKGLGKTSSARIVAKAVNCERIARSTSEVGEKNTKKTKSTTHVPQPTNDIEPCNQCDMCVSITNGSNMDILEIDAASNRGIDEIRDLREKIWLAPSRASKKVYIIDEVHMLTTEAFNALLKTLEEPPKHALFILATTEPHKVPETIISRCLHVSFRLATSEELVRSLQRIVDGEGIMIDQKPLEDIADLSDGGFRDGAKILEELVSLSKNKTIDKDLFEKRFHTVSIKNAANTLLIAFGKRDTKKGFEIIHNLTRDGIDFSYLLTTLLSILHTILLVKAGVKIDNHFEKTASLFSMSDIRVLFTLLQTAASDMKYSVIPQLPFELALIEYAAEKKEKVISDKQIEQKVEEKIDEVTLKTLRKEAGSLAKKQLLTQAPEKKSPVEPKETENGNLLSYQAEGDLTDEWISDFWQGVIHKMKEYNHTLAGVMRGCRVKSFDRKTLVIETKFTFHKDRLSEEKTLLALEKVCKDLTGNTTKVFVELVDTN